MAARRRVWVMSPATRPCAGLRACGRGLRAASRAPAGGGTCWRTLARAQQPSVLPPSLRLLAPFAQGRPLAIGRGSDGRDMSVSLALPPPPPSRIRGRDNTPEQFDVGEPPVADRAGRA